MLLKVAGKMEIRKKVVTSEGCKKAIPTKKYPIA
jgi:hypothetical protein